MPPLSLYVHLPWCVRKCPYCDFNSHALKSAQPDATYIDTLLADFDLDWPLVQGRRIDSIFFGGGTPSLFAPREFERLLRGLRARADIAADAEITLEANPGAIEHGAFEGYAAAGINRVSLGAQSFSAVALQRLGRIHAPGDIERAVLGLRAAGLANFNLDLMYALPEQGLEEALHDLRAAIALAPAHLSHYQLTLEPGTVFAARPPPLPDEDLAFQMQCESQALLAQAGYAQYEVSAYARAGRRCVHNLNYWQFGDYIGIGAGAHGKLTLGGPLRILRTAKPKQPREYQRGIESAARGAATRTASGPVSAVAGGSVSDPGAPVSELGAPVGERREVPAAELPFEFMLNALRLNAGFDLQQFQARTGLDAAAIQVPLSRALARGLLAATPYGWAPTVLGRRFLNDLQQEFLT